MAGRPRRFSPLTRRSCFFLAHPGKERPEDRAVFPLQTPQRRHHAVNAQALYVARIGSGIDRIRKGQQG